jgi:hypothetical protein
MAKVVKLIDQVVRKQKLKSAVRYFYDLQRLRIQAGNRAIKQVEESKAILDDDDKKFLGNMGEGLEGLEKGALDEVKRLLKGIPIYEQWLKDQRGIGPTLSGFLIAEIDISKANTVSSLWKYCGLHVNDGKAAKPRKGEQIEYKPMMKTKLIGVMGSCLIKATSYDESGYFKIVKKVRRKIERDVVWRRFYDDKKHRRESQILPTCMRCNGKGKAMQSDDEVKLEKGEKKPKKEITCPNCNGTGGPVAWGCSDAHRHNDAVRYMVKMFLQQLWLEWRKIEGLAVRVPYAEEKLGVVHHG